MKKIKDTVKSLIIMPLGVLYIIDVFVSALFMGLANPRLISDIELQDRMIDVLTDRRMNRYFKYVSKWMV